MCGIAGYKTLTNQNKEIHDEHLLAMQRSLAHRGPDGGGIWKSQKHQIGFAHRRLSIIDLSKAGLQPMVSNDGNTIVCYNGEVYNYQEIKKNLIDLGHTFRTNTDTEVLIHAFQEWGIQFIQKLEGMFAFALFDKKKNELYLVRDRIGIKPLYFSTRSGFISFASEIKALWQLPWMHKAISPVAASHYFTFMVTPAPYTLYKNIYKLPAGFFAKCDAHNNLTFHEWYSPITTISNQEKKDFANERFCIKNIQHLLTQATKKRMISDVPFGAFLSGGIDSSLNVALMAQHIKKVKTFTVAFAGEEETNELKWARLIAKKFDTDHHELIITEQNAFDFYKKMTYHLDEPLADCVCIPFYYIAKLARERGLSVVQVGEGSDELFFGYNIYAQYQKIYKKFWKPTLHLVPPFAKKLTYLGAKMFLSKRNHLMDTLYKWGYDQNLFWGGATATNAIQKKVLLAAANIEKNDFEHDPIIEKIYPGLEQSYDSHTIIDYHMKKLQERDPHASFIKAMAYIELKQRLPELLLMRADKMAMATSIEGRVPFLDHKLVEFALNIPDHIKFKANTTKYILKKACEGIIPDKIIYRKKVGFGAPIIRWFSHQGPFVKQFQDNNLFVKNSSNNVYSNALQKWVLQNFASAKSGLNPPVDG